jgi:hypothetical protein
MNSCSVAHQTDVPFLRMWTTATTIVAQCCADMRSSAHRASHVVEAVKDRHEVVAFPGDFLGFRYLEGDTVRSVPGSHESVGSSPNQTGVR